MKQISCFFLLLALSYWSIQPFTLPGFFPMHDDTQPARVYEMYQALSHGQFPVRWVPDLGYGSGYPIFNFYAPLPYYLGAIPMFWGMDALTATKLMMAIGVVLAGVSMFFLGNAIGGPLVGLVAGTVYLYAPYHAAEVYVRGAVGEIYGYGFLPGVFLALLWIFSKRRRRGIITGSVFCALVLLSHNILGMLMIMGLGVGFLAYLLKGTWQHTLMRNRLIYRALLVMVALGIGLSGFFIGPAILEKDYTKITTLTEGSSDFRHHFVYLDQLWDSPWGFAGSAQGREDGMSFKIGKIHVLLGGLSFLLLLILYHKKRLFRSSGPLGLLALALFLVSIFFMTSPSLFLWEHIPGFAYIQYPWRFLNVTLFSLALSVAVLLSALNGRVQVATSVLVTAFILFFNIKYFVPAIYNTKTAEDYVTTPQLFFSISKISDEYLPKEYRAPGSITDIVPAGIPQQPRLSVMETTTSLPTDHTYLVAVSADSWIATTFSYYPGWRATIDGQPTRIRSGQGNLHLFVPIGEHRIRLQVRSTPVQTIANAISLFAVFLLAYVSRFRRVIIPWRRNHPLTW